MQYMLAKYWIKYKNTVVLSTDSNDLKLKGHFCKQKQSRIKFMKHRVQFSNFAWRQTKPGCCPHNSCKFFLENAGKELVRSIAWTWNKTEVSWLFFTNKIVFPVLTIVGQSKMNNGRKIWGKRKEVKGCKENKKRKDWWNELLKYEENYPYMRGSLTNGWFDTLK